MGIKVLQTASNYTGTDNALHGCLNDMDTTLHMLSAIMADPNTVTRLLGADFTAAAVRAALAEFAADAQPGDLIVWDNSSHGTQVKDINGDEADGLDEAICPNDFAADWEHNLITDDEVHRWLSGIPAGVTVVMIMDSCHSGTMERGLYLKPRCIRNPLLEGIDHLLHRKDKAGRVIGDKDVRCNVVLIPGCKESQTSADAYLGGTYEGALHHYLASVARDAKGQITYQEWVVRTAELLHAEGYAQSSVLAATAGMAEKRIFAV